MKYHRRSWAARTPTTTTPPDGPWPSRRRSRCSSATRSTPAAPATRWSISLAEGHQGAGRGPPPVPPLDRHRPDDPRMLRARDAEGVSGRRAVSAVRRLDAVHASTHARRADAEEAPVLRDARHPRHLGGRLEGGRRPRAASRARAISTRTSGSSTTSTWTAPKSTDLAEQHPEKLEELIKAWFEEAGKNNVLPLDDRTALEMLADRAPPGRSRRATLRLLPGHGAGSGVVAVNIRGRSYKILADVEIDEPGLRRA